MWTENPESGYIILLGSGKFQGFWRKKVHLEGRHGLLQLVSWITHIHFGFADASGTGMARRTMDQPSDRDLLPCGSLQ